MSLLLSTPSGPLSPGLLFKRTYQQILRSDRTTTAAGLPLEDVNAVDWYFMASYECGIPLGLYFNLLCYGSRLAFIT